ncbi:unnamed protein product [Rotaria sordida]|uniref:Cytochrome P450 n=1 Tax=Rotaria sordida TaxID=392033 RepID=A0A814PTQ1_9BILA|nr:unnamed protein product [Rotaria sordida]CAF3702956.1 unnamed protein product [Rotaria sordida]
MIVTLILITIILILYLIHIYRCYLFFKCRGIDGPRPTFFLGNVADFARTKRISISIHNWTKQFGRIYGYFEGHTPVFVISEPDILDKIFRKYFSKFHSRRQFPLEERSTTKGVHLFSATGDEWRRQRNIINPTFSRYKINRMLPIINDCITNLMIKLDECIKIESEGFDIYKLYKCLTMDLIWRCCFSIKTDMQNNPNNPYLIRSQQVFARENCTFLTTLLGIFIPELQPCWLFIHCWINKIKAKLREYLPMGDKLIADDPSEWLKENVKYFVEKAPENCDETDLLHLMLEATERNINNTNQKNSSKRLLTLNEVKQNIYLFMIAGYETASTALAYVTHILATHPNEQKKLQDYIDRNISNDTILDYDALNKIECLDWFIRETLRMYPITPIIINRQCSEQIDLPELGCILPGTKFTLDMYSLHYDNELWGPVDTKIFYPERFATERHPLAWVAFGAGPRNCVGMKFALTEIKITIIRLLQKYTIVPSTSTNEDLELVELVTIAPKQLKVRLEPRTQIL